MWLLTLQNMLCHAWAKVGEAMRSDRFSSGFDQVAVFKSIEFQICFYSDNI